MVMSTPSSLRSTHGVDRDALVRVVEPVVRAHGAELVDVELKSEQHGWVLRVFVETAGAAEHNLSTRDAAVDLELCANVSRDLSPALDVADLVSHAYHLEVSSPGVERALRTERDFARFAGQRAKIKVREAVAGQRVFVGTLDGVAGGKVRVSEGKRTHELPIASVEKAHLLFELAPQPKGAKKKH